MIRSVDYSLIPERIMNNILGYVEGTEMPGGFLYAVLSNDLFKSIAKADDEVLKMLPLIVHYIHWQVPSACHGSPEHVKEWMNKTRLKESVS